MKPTLVNLEVDYDNLLILKANNSEDSGFKLAIFGREVNQETDEVEIKFNNIKELEDVITDFKNKCKVLKIKV